MEYLKIIEENFTTEEFIAYLRGSILKQLLQEEPLVLSEFKLYANKLVEVVKAAPKQPTVDPDEPRVFKFKIGDHVIVSKGTDDERTGVIVRLPMDGVDCRTSYVVDLNDKNLGWTATVAVDGVDCKNAWVASEKNMELLPEKPENTLEKDKWYHTTDFTVEELTELLPKGTTVVVEDEAWYKGIETEPPTNTTTVVVHSISTSVFGEQTFIETTQGAFMKEWFKITEEN